MITLWSHSWSGHNLFRHITCSGCLLHPLVSIRPLLAKRNTCARLFTLDWIGFPVFTRLSINPAPLPPPTLRSFRQLHSIDVGSFLTDLESSQLISDPPKSLGPLLSAYNTALSSLLDKHAPIVNKLSRRQSPSNPWFSATLRAFWSTLRHAENIWKRTHSAADWSSFKSLRNQYHKLILSSKKRVLLQPRIFSLRQPQTSLANSQ